MDANSAIGIVGRQELGKIETSGPELLVAAVGCARKAGQPQESAVRERRGRSRDEGAREGQDRLTREEFGICTSRSVESRTHS